MIVFLVHAGGKSSFLPVWHVTIKDFKHEVQVKSIGVVVQALYGVGCTAGSRDEDMRRISVFDCGFRLRLQRLLPSRTNKAARSGGPFCSQLSNPAQTMHAKLLIHSPYAVVFLRDAKSFVCIGLDCWS